jgi:RNA polymerase sigma-70 factor (ECF subfamily)
MPLPSDFHAQLEGQRDYLLRYATLQLRDADRAEDCVQETLLAALAGQAGYDGRSSLRTWLTGILKHKIVDAIRRSSREPAMAIEPDDGASDFDALFDPRGHWTDAPAAWERPDSALERSQFLAALEACLAQLSAKTARAFMMREHMGLETGEICKELGVSATNCWVMLYRARMALRLCLEKGWFGGKESPRE